MNIMNMKMEVKNMINLTSIKVLTKDIKRIVKLKIHKTEPRWSVIERTLDKLDGEKK